MAAVPKFGTPKELGNLDTHQRAGSGYIAGEDMAQGDMVCLVPNAAAVAAGVPVMNVMRAYAGADNALAIAVGACSLQARVAQGDAVTIIRDCDWVYGQGMLAAFLQGASGPVFVYLSASVYGGLDTTPPWAGAQPVGIILDDTRIRIFGSNSYFDSGTPAIGTIQAKTVVVALGTGAGAGGAFSWANPEATPIIVTRVVVDVKTVATAACSLDIGYTTTNGTTLSDTLLDGIDVHTATGLFDNLLAANAGVNGLTAAKAAVGKWITGSQASGAIAGLVGNVYITYYVVAS